MVLSLSHCETAETETLRYSANCSFVRSFCFLFDFIIEPIELAQKYGFDLLFSH